MRLDWKMRQSVAVTPKVGVVVVALVVEFVKAGILCAREPLDAIILNLGQT